ncbi:MAG: hypothetical protein ACRCZO_20340 [Cetobacterium sp.]
MKKLLTLLSLALTVSAFGAPTGNKEESATMNVTATVIKPLTIKVTKDMAFGTIIQGTKADATGAYAVAGEPGATVDITTTLPKTLTNATRSAGLDIDFEGLSEGKTSLTLNESGNLALNINGSINPTTDTPTGEYSGEIIARVQYQ